MIFRINEEGKIIDILEKSPEETRTYAEDTKNVSGYYTEQEINKRLQIGFSENYGNKESLKIRSDQRKTLKELQTLKFDLERQQKRFQLKDQEILKLEEQIKHTENLKRQAEIELKDVIDRLKDDLTHIQKENNLLKEQEEKLRHEQKEIVEKHQQELETIKEILGGIV